jgi:hypothetical protein
MRRSVLAALAGLALVVCTRAQSPAPPTSVPKAAAETLRDFVVKNKTRHAVGLYMQNKKVGWMIVELGLLKYQGREVAAEKSEMMMSLLVEGKKSDTSEKEVVYYSLDGDGPIIFAENTKIEDGKQTIYTAVPTAKGMAIRTRMGNKEVSSREVTQPKANLDQSRRLMIWLQGSRKAGDKFDHWATDWDEAKVDNNEEFTYLEKKSIVWGGVKSDLHHVKVKIKGAVMDADVLADGNPIRGKIGGILEMRAEAEETVKNLDATGVDLMEYSSIRVDRDLGNSKTITGLMLEVDGLKDFKFPESHRQRLRKENGKTILDLWADYRIDKAAPLSDDERKEFTSATPTIQCDHERVRKLAAQVVGDAADPLKKARRIKSWVYQNLNKRLDANSSTTLGVLERMAGDCTEHTLLFVSLARAAGVPAREITGVAHVAGSFGWHAWAEVHDGHQWVSVDPTWDELYVDATHIVFSHDNDDHAWLNVLGSVSFKTLIVERKK